MSVESFQRKIKKEGSSGALAKRIAGSRVENAVVAAIRVPCFVDHVTKRNEDSGNENEHTPKRS